MMRIWWIILVAFGLSGIIDPAARKGRKGNKHVERQEYAQAVIAYRQGLRYADETDARVRAGLYHNLGVALYRQKEMEEAYRQFQWALQEAPEERMQAHIAYNAGNAAYRLGRAEDALRYYREALLRNPFDEQARFNYEFVRRKLQQQKQHQGGGQQQHQLEDNRQEQPRGGRKGGQKSRQNRQQQAPQPSPSPGSRQEQQQAPGNQQQTPQQNEQASERRQEGGQQGKLTREQALRLLQALEGDEKEVIRQLQRAKVKPRKAKKDW